MTKQCQEFSGHIGDKIFLYLIYLTTDSTSTKYLYDVFSTGIPSIYLNITERLLLFQNFSLQFDLTCRLLFYFPEVLKYETKTSCFSFQ